MTLSSSIDGPNDAKPGQMVTLECRTYGSGLLEWASDEYIGSRNLLIVSHHQASDIVTSDVNQNTTARRLSVTVDEGVIVLVSELQIIVSALYSNATITCRNIAFQTNKSMTFGLDVSSKEFSLTIIHAVHVDIIIVKSYTQLHIIHNMLDKCL